MNAAEWATLFVIVCLSGFLLWIFWMAVKAAMRKESPVSTVDDTSTDLDGIADLISRLPGPIVEAIAAGKLSLALDWEEVTRDEDDYPTIKPRIRLGAPHGLSGE